MIRFNCKVEQTLPFTQLLPFQGNLKASTDEEIARLASSLLSDGLITPFIIWRKPAPMEVDPIKWDEEQPNYVIDGHRRLLAIQHIAQTVPEVLTQEYPILIVEAPDVETAKNQLLQICSSYGKITPKGLEGFLVDAPKIKLENLGLKIKLPKVNVASTEPVSLGASLKAEYTIMKLRVKKSDVARLTELLSQSNVEVL